MNDFASLRADHILYGLDCMISFAEFADDRQVAFDLGAGTVTVENEAVAVSVVGSWAGPPTSSWLWAWANPGWRDLPPQTLSAAHVIQGLASLTGEPRFSTAEIPMDNDTFGFEVTAIACGLTSAAGATGHQHSGGSAFFVLPTLPRGTSDEVSRHVRVIAQGLQSYEVDHRRAVSSYLSKVGYDLTESQTEIVATRPDAVVTATFDELGRLTACNFKAGPSSEPPAAVSYTHLTLPTTPYV